jgi:hypothetical protein
VGVVGATPGILAGVAVGGAATVALQPAFEVPRQDAWARNANRILDAGLLARLVAQGGVDLADAQSEALRDGYAADKLDALIYLEQTVPGFAEAINLWRRGLIADGDFAHVLVKAGLDQRYTAPLMALKDAEIVGIGDLAYGVVRGILPAPSWVPVAPPTSGTSVPRFPQVNIDPVAEAAKLGYPEDQFQLMVGRSGLSLAPGLAAQAYFRGLINADDYLLAIAEGDLRTEWAQTLQDASRAILSPHDYAELQLRGFQTQTQRDAGAAKHGMGPNDAQLLYDVLGRAPNIHAVTTGLARGGTYDGTPQTIPEPFLSAVQRADIRPEWYSIEYANRFTYPSAFVLRALAQAGDLGGQAEVEQVLLELGWKPSFATQVSTAWTASATTGDPHVAKAQTQLWGTTHAAYKAGEIAKADAQRNLTTLGIPAAAQTQVLTYWDAERATVRKQLTLAELKKAYTLGADNPATGQPWTAADVTAELLARGFSADDAKTILEEW